MTLLRDSLKFRSEWEDVAAHSALGPSSYERSARRDVRFWGMLVIGLAFISAAVIVDPRSNCDSSGECAPWLVPLAFVLGAMLALAGLAQLLANPRRGSRIDSASGDLIWWQARIGEGDGDQGRIHPSQIAKIRIVRQDDSNDCVHLYDLQGERQPYFDEEVIPWPYDQWAKGLAARWPHISIEEE